MAAAAFSETLRDWRRRRRVSQLELALRAGTTQRHVSFVESGRSAPGRAMVIRLAEALEVPLRERNALLDAAGYAPAYRSAALDDEALSAVRTALDRILEGHLPYPAIVVERGGTLIGANAAFDALVRGCDPALLEPPVNVARLLLDPRGLAPRIANLDAWAWHVLDRLRADAERHPDARLTALAAELEAHVPGRAAGPGHLGFAVPLRLRHGAGELQLLTTLTHFGTTVDVALSELRLEAFLPADEQTARLLADGL